MLCKFSIKYNLKLYPQKIKKNYSSKKILLTAYFVFSSLIIIIPALFNGYPLFYSDSALYIKASMLFGKLPSAEKIPYLSGLGYAFFVRAVTWKTTLWLVVFAQAVILNILIFRVIKALFAENKTIRYHLPILIILSLFSSMGWTASQLMPDIFTSYIILSIFLFYNGNNKNLWIYFFLSVIIIISILSHLSNIGIYILLVFMIILLFLLLKSYRRNFKIFIRKTVMIIVLVCVSFFILKGLNKKYYNEYVLSPTSHIFFMARLMDTGFMKDFLNEKCDEKSYEMCKYKDSLLNSYDSFLWNPKSVFNKTGGWDLEKHKDYKDIARDVISSPKYLSLFLCNCGIHSLWQLVTWKTGDGLTNIFNKESAQYQAVIKNYNRGEFRNDFQSSKQMQAKLNFDYINLINNIFLFVSVLIIIWTFILKKQDKSMKFFTYIIFCGVMINAVVTSSLASVFDRFQSRIIWMIPLLASIYFFKFLYPTLIKSKRVI
jgi:hypothetical protein